jgi:hypothetical protein
MPVRARANVAMPHQNNVAPAATRTVPKTARRIAAPVRSINNGNCQSSQSAIMKPMTKRNVGGNGVPGPRARRDTTVGNK